MARDEDEHRDPDGPGTTDEELDELASELDSDFDELADEPEAERTFDGEPTPSEPPPSRLRLGPWLVGIAGGAWALAAVIRCGGPTPGPGLAVTPDEATAPEPASAVEPEAQATPAADAPDPAPARAKDEHPTPEGPDEPQDENAVDPHPEPASWARDLKTPEQVRYTIRRGGSLENVANLFKIYHHEILELNPGVELQKELPPNTAVLVYRREPGAVSESVGLPSDGGLEGAVPMLEGPGRVLKAIPWKSWGTAHTVILLDAVLRQWAARGKVQPVLVGNMSARTGGRLQPHSTHQSGRDVDLGYPQVLPSGEELNWREMSAQNLDAAETWNLLFLLAQTGSVEVVYIDRSIQKLLYEHALDKKLMSKRSLSRWMEYPRATGSGDPLIQHVNGHIDHLHVRFDCLPHEDRCRSRH